MELQQRYLRKTDALVGCRICSVTYWDVYNYSDEPRSWDFGDWHHAVMGVELLTDQGPVTVIWTDTFFPYGVEAFPESISRHLFLGEYGPQGWPVSDNLYWRERSGSPITSVSTFWETIHVGPGICGGVVVSEAETHEVPVALRLDFAAGPVWMVAGIPQWPNVESVFIPGDEILVVFSSARMRKIGFQKRTSSVMPRQSSCPNAR